MQSVFTDVGKLSLQDPAHSAVIPMPAGQTTAPCASTAWLSHQGEAHYALTSPAGGILVVTLPPNDAQGKVWTDLQPITATQSSVWKIIDLTSGCNGASGWVLVQAACPWWS